jgi:hypothetical protein
MMIQPTPQIHHHMQITRLNNIDYFNFIFSDTKMNPNEYRCACVCQNVNNCLDHHLQINDNISNGIKSLQGLTAAATLFLLFLMILILILLNIFINTVTRIKKFGLWIFKVFRPIVLRKYKKLTQWTK